MALPPAPKSPSPAPPSPGGPPVAVDGVTIVTDALEELDGQQVSDAVTDSTRARAMVDVLSGEVIRLCQLSDAQSQLAERIRVKTINAAKVIRGFTNTVNERSGEVLALIQSRD